jgi:hypothetical protein
MIHNHEVPGSSPGLATKKRQRLITVSYRPLLLFGALTLNNVLSKHQNESIFDIDILMYRHAIKCSELYIFFVSCIKFVWSLYR